MSRSGLGGAGRGKPVNVEAYANPPGANDGSTFQGGNYGQAAAPTGFGQSQGFQQGNGGGFGQSGSQNSFGQGGFGQGGFNQGSGSAQQNEDPWGNNGGQQGGFGNQRDGFQGGGQSGGYGRGGFGSRNSRGGYSNASSETCRNCGETGHFARECSAPRPDRPRGCFSCGDVNHKRQDCPENQGGQNQNSGGFQSGGFGGGGFNNSSTNRGTSDQNGFGGGGGDGANSFGGGGFGGGGNDGTNSFGGGGFGGGGFGNSNTNRGTSDSDQNGFSGGGSDGANSFGGGGFGGGGFNNDRDHSDALPPRGRGRGGGGCHNCGEIGHLARDCSKPRSNENRPGGRSDTCYNCKQTGHLARDCTAPSQQSDSTARKPASTYVPVEASMDDLWNEHIKTGIHFDRYYHIPVDVSGSNTTEEPIKTFDEAGLPPQLLENVRKAGYEMPTPIQQRAIPYILGERDLMACAQTGSGKTAAFLLPVLAAMMKDESLMNTIPGDRQEPVVVIIAPTRELALQIKDEARKFSAGTQAKVVPVYGGTSTYGQKMSLRPGCNICVATPGRLLDFVDKGIIRLHKCKFLVLDEADRMLDLGFERDIRRLVQQSDMPPKTERQTLMFSATFPDAIQMLATEFLNDHIFITVGKVGAANMDIVQEIVLVKDTSEKKDLVLKYVLESVNASKDESGKFHKKTMVFVERKRVADYLALQLSSGGDEDDPNSAAVKATSLHGDREQSERELVFRQFKSGEFPVLVATDVAARGLDIQEVDHVINYDMPKDITDYVHRIGRTARVGNVGMSTSFFDMSNDVPIAPHLVKVLTDAQQQVPDWLEEVARTGSYNQVESGGGEPQSDEPWC